MKHSTKQSIGKAIIFAVLFLSAVAVVSVAYCEVRDAVEAKSQSVAVQQQRQAENRRVNDRVLRISVGLFGFFLFSYLMGRRRLATKLWKRNKSLIQARDRAEESDRMKTAFIQNMSHEIRTPLNAVAGFSHVLCDPSYHLSPEEKQDMRKRITVNVENITAIVNELLELSQTESHRTETDMHDVKCNELCHSVLMTFENKVADGVEMKFRTDLDDDFTVRTHGATVWRILTHLLDNAVKFTEKGSIELYCTRHLTPLGRRLQISVTDTGIGISAEDRDRVFEKFSKVNDFKEGIGLGLPISRRLAQAISAELSIDPHYQDGTRFVLAIPLPLK